MNFEQVYKVARREYIARVRNKAFIIMTIMVPVFLVSYIAMRPLLFEGTGREELKIAILDSGTGLGDELAKRLSQIEAPRILVAQSRSVQKSSEEEDRQALNQAVLKEELDGYMLLTPDAEMVASVRYYARETGNPVVMRRLEDAVQETLFSQALAGSSVNLERVLNIQKWDLQMVTVSSQGEEEGGFEANFISTMVFTMLLYMAVLINGQGMAMAIVEEKSSRLIEVILGAVTASEFMAGKILGVLGSGITQLVIWIAVALIAVLYALPAMAIGAAEMGFDLAAILNFNLLFYFAILFVLGYFLYSTVFAVVAATCSSTEELSQAMFPAMLPMVFALFTSFYVSLNPSTLAAKLLSLFPFFTPLVMLARVNVLMPALWEVWLGIVLLMLSSLGVAWLAAKIFRFALLMQGKRPSFKEIARMIQAA